MSWNRTRFLFVSLLVTSALVVSACGDDDEEPASKGVTPSTKAPEGKKGGKLTVLAASDVDYLDPGHTFYTWGYAIQMTVNRALYYFKPPDFVKPTPDIAEGEPEVAADKKTITVKLKKGIKYAPPVDREVTSADIKYAFERFFSANVGGQYANYFNSIVGSPAEPTKGVKPISGITTPDDQTVVFKLKDANGVAFAAALTMPIAIPVPKEYASKHDAKNPSTYNTHIAMTGPYMIKNDSTGKLTGYKTAKSIDIVRNPNWDESTDFRPAYLDSMFFRTNVTNADVAARQVLSGKSLALDTNPPANILKTVITRQKDQLLQVPSGGFRYFSINTTIKPFDNLNVRKAVAAGFDRIAARKARGGAAVGDIASHFLPPGFPGFEESGGFDGTGVDYLTKENEGGDDALAAEYMKKAGYPSGKYTGNETFLMLAANVDPGKAQTLVAKREFEELGFKIRVRQVPQDAVYTEYCQVPEKKILTCGSAGWFKDFNDPQAMLLLTFCGCSISKGGGNNNLAELNSPEVDKLMEEAKLLEGDERLKKWGEVNKAIVAQAPGVPFVWDKTSLIASPNVNKAGDGYIALWNFPFMSLK